MCGFDSLCLSYGSCLLESLKRGPGASDVQRDGEGVAERGGGRWAGSAEVWAGDAPLLLRPHDSPTCCYGPRAVAASGCPPCTPAPPSGRKAEGLQTEPRGTAARLRSETLTVRVHLCARDRAGRRGGRATLHSSEPPAWRRAAGGSSESSLVTGQFQTLVGSPRIWNCASGIG